MIRVFPTHDIKLIEGPVPGQFFNCGAAVFLDMTPHDAEYAVGLGWISLSFNKNRIPTMTSTVRDAYAAPGKTVPDTGMFICNSTTGAIEFYNGGHWVNAVTGA